MAELLGLSEEDEEELLVRLIDEFLSMTGVQGRRALPPKMHPFDFFPRWR